jgi:formate-dependent phosphoribosylglycinamide formyltransferase (GAR transformylase)
LRLEALSDSKRRAGIGYVLQQDGELIPPSRAATSAFRRHHVRRLATSRSTLSPSWWPNESFMSLKSSRSMNSKATLLL